MKQLPESRHLPEGFSYHPEGYLWFNLPIENFSKLPDSLIIDGELFNKKSEFHVTVANIRGIARVIGRDDEDVVEETGEALKELFLTYIQTATVRFLGFDDDIRFAIKGDRKSLAVRCRMEGIEGFFGMIKDEFGYDFPLQPAHVSLYTLTGMAVGIDSNEQMESYKEVPLPEVQTILNHIS